MKKNNDYCEILNWCGSVIKENAPTGNRGILAEAWRSPKNRQRDMSVIITLHAKQRNVFMEWYG